MAKQSESHPDQEAPAPTSGPDASDAPAAAEPNPKKLSLTHVFLATNTLAIIALVVLVAWLPLRRSAVANQTQITIETPEIKPIGKAEKSETSAPAPQDDSDTVSWARAAKAFGEKDYAAALGHYSVLYRIARNSPEPDIAGELFGLRMAQCLEQLGKPVEAGKLLQLAAAGRSPIVRGVANYHIAVSEMSQGLYMRARRRVYLAAAALAGLSRPAELESNCDFLVARIVTQKALSYFDKSDAIGWGSLGKADPFYGLDEVALRKLLRDGVEESFRPLLGPRIQQIRGTSHQDLWKVETLRTPISELLKGFATVAQTDLRWVSTSPAVRNRPVSLSLRGVSGQRLCELAAGSAGLIVRFSGEAVFVCDPAAYESLKQQRDLMVSEAVVVWRRLFLRSPRDSRITDGHFALAMLQACSGDTVGAIEGYRAMAAKFKTASLAPAALLEGAKLRIALRDYAGAGKELLTLLDTYPGAPVVAEAYSCLGQATMASGKPGEAFRLFKKLYFMSDSLKSKMAACLGAGKSLHKQGKYDAAVKWLDDYIALAKKAGKSDLSEVYILLGRCLSVLGQTRKAGEAFTAVLSNNPTHDQRIEASVALSGAWRRAGDLPRALALLLDMSKDLKTDAQKHQVFSMTAGCYRDMGLPELGAAFLKANILNVSESELRAKLQIDQARCYSDAGRFTTAHAILTEAPKKLSPGGQARRAACDLAEVCLRIGRPAQAAVVADGVLKLSPSGLYSKRARKILSRAHLAAGDYEKAVGALADIPIDQLGVKQK